MTKEQAAAIRFAAENDGLAYWQARALETALQELGVTGWEWQSGRQACNNAIVFPEAVVREAEAIPGGSPPDLTAVWLRIQPKQSATSAPRSQAKQKPAAGAARLWAPGEAENVLARAKEEREREEARQQARTRYVETEHGPVPSEAFRC